MKAHVAIIVTAVAIATGSAAAQNQKPAEATRDAQHQQAMQGLTDAQFASMMAKHHQDGIEMARAEESGGSSSTVKALAAKIRQSQEKDLPELKSHAARSSAPTGTSGSTEHDKMMEQQSQTMMSRLKSTSGSARDHAFLEEMSKHHEQAINMTEGAKLQDPELKKLAQRMLTEQRQEVAELKKELSTHAK